MRCAPIFLLILTATSVSAIEPPELSTSGLSNLLVEGHDIHPSLVTRRLDNTPIRHVPRGVLHTNPQHSADAEFINAIARSGSQGKLGGEGIRSALYALYLADRDVGFYGLEAATEQDANRLEAILRETWSRNMSINRARVYRHGLVLVVTWNDGISPASWEAVNSFVDVHLSSFR